MFFEQLIPTLRGIWRYLLRPRFFSVFRARIAYFRRKPVALPIITPENFTLSSEQALVSYWDLFVERSLYHPDWVQHIKQGSPVVLDIGANSGIFSELIYSLNPKAKVIAFEPQADPALTRVAKSHPGMVVQNVAISDKRETFVLYMAKPPSTTASRISTMIDWSGETLNVTAVPLDDLYPDLKSVDLIKIDVDGGELEVFRGMERILAVTKFIVVEICSPENLEAVGKILPGWQRTQLSYTDYLYVNTKR